MAGTYTYTIWRRKTASAQVRLFEGKGTDMINGKQADSYVARADLFDALYAPLKLCKAKDNFYFEAQVLGSWESAQVSAIAHGLSRALAGDEGFKAILKSAGLLTRDARKVERKKPGRHKARKAMQWSKR